MRSLLAIVVLVAALVASCNATQHTQHTPHSIHIQQQTHTATAPTAHAPSPSQPAATLPVVLDLGSSASASWTATNANGSVSVPATVPGNIYTDLVAAGVLGGDPLYRDNERFFQWVASDSWTWSAQFDASAAMLACPTITLEALGIDTVATLTLNGQPLGSTSNMHLRYTFPLAGLLKPSSNVLEIAIQSPLEAALQRAQAYPYFVPRTVQIGSFDNGNFLRKAASDFGWDWGPAFAGSGIWQPLRIVGTFAATLVSATVHQTHASTLSTSERAAQKLQQGDVALRISAFFEVGPSTPLPTSGSLCVSLDLTATGGQVVSQCSSVTLGPYPPPDVLGQYSADISIVAPAAAVQLWWPAGYGAQPLSPLTVSFMDRAALSTSLTLQVGFRTTELLRAPGPAGLQNGTSFTFVINGLPIFAKGANMIPVTSFHGSATDAEIIAPLQSLLDTGGNVVRVWGGGVYQRESLYAFADARGILIWQEFAFACAMYPRDTAFLSSVAAEVTYQLRRLASHPAIMVFGGNNENEVAMGWFDVTREHRDIYLVDYAKLYLDTIRAALIAEIGLEVPFVSSSPSRGPQSMDPYTQLWGAGESNDYGDVHYYNYNDDCGDVSTLPRARFVSEFGFQSLPSLLTYAPVLSEADGDYGWNSSMMHYRQRHDQGNEQMRAMMALHFNLPDAQDPTQQFDDWIYLTQATQSVCYRTALTYWRRIKSEAPGQTMGIIYWQLNDLWQGPTWSSLEYGGRWKALQYEVARAYAPLIISGHYDNASDAAVVYLTSDVPQPLANINISVAIVSYATGAVQASYSALENLASLESRLVYTLSSLSSAFAAAGCAATSDCFLRLRATGAPNADILPAPLRTAPLQVPNFNLSGWSAGSNADADAEEGQAPSASSLLTSASFTLSSDVVASYVFLETPLSGRFSDNSFTLLPSEAPRAMSFQSFAGSPGFTLAQLQQSVRIRSIRGTYTTAEDDSSNNNNEDGTQETEVGLASE